MSEDDDITQEEDVIKEEERSSSGSQATTTDFSKISFFVDEPTHDESVEDDNSPTDSFDALDNTDEEIATEDSDPVLDTTEDD